MKKSAFLTVSQPPISYPSNKTVKKYDFFKKSISRNGSLSSAINANAEQKVISDACEDDLADTGEDPDSTYLAEYREAISNIDKPLEKLRCKKDLWEIVLRLLHIWHNDSYDVLRFLFYSKKGVPRMLKRLLCDSKVKTDQCATEKMLVKALRRYHYEVLHCCVTDGLEDAMPWDVRLLVLDIERTRPLADRMLSRATSVMCFADARDEMASKHFFTKFYTYVLRNVLFCRAYNNAVEYLNNVPVEPKYTPVLVSGHTAALRSKNAVSHK